MPPLPMPRCALLEPSMTRGAQALPLPANSAQQCDTYSMITPVRVMQPVINRPTPWGGLLRVTGVLLFCALATNYLLDRAFSNTQTISTLVLLSQQVLDRVPGAPLALRLALPPPPLHPLPPGTPSPPSPLPRWCSLCWPVARRGAVAGTWMCPPLARCAGAPGALPPPSLAWMQTQMAMPTCTPLPARPACSAPPPPLRWPLIKAARAWCWPWQQWMAGAL